MSGVGPVQGVLKQCAWFWGVNPVFHMGLKYFLPHGLSQRSLGIFLGRQGLQRSRPWVPFPTQGDTCPPTPPLTGGSSPGREVKELPGLASPALLGFSTPPSWGSQLTARKWVPSASPQLQPPLRVAGIAGLGWIIQNNSSLAGSPWGRGKLTFQTLVFLSNFPEFLGLGTSGQSSVLPRLQGRL